MHSRPTIFRLCTTVAAITVAASAATATLTRQPAVAHAPTVVTPALAARTTKPRTAPGEADAHVPQALGAHQQLATVTEWLATTHASIVNAPRRLPA